LAYAAFPRAKPKAPAVTVVHENRGLVEHHKDVSRRLATAGYVGLAIDLVSPQGGTEKFTDSAEVSTYLSKTPPERHVEILNAGVRYLQQLPAARRHRHGHKRLCLLGGVGS